MKTLPKPNGFWSLAVGFLLSAQGSWAESRWSTSFTLGPERFAITSSQGGASVDHIPWAGRLSFQYSWREHLALRVATGFLTGSRTEKVTPARGSGNEVETKLWGYPLELRLAFPLEVRKGLTFLPGAGLGYCRLRYEEKEKIGGTTSSNTMYRLSGFGGVLSAGLEARATDRLFLFGEVRSGLPLLRESWSEGSDSTQTTYVRNVRPTWSGMALGFRWMF